MKELIQVIYDFETEDKVEESAFKCMIGGDNIYNAIRMFKDAGKSIEEATKFFEGINDAFKILNLLN